MSTSPLHSAHEALEASFTDFGGWDMPLKYDNELDEHRAVRHTAGLFDLSHMGEIEVEGPGAGDFLDYALISNLSALNVGKAKYSMIVNDNGGIIDDLITYKLAEDRYLVVPNAGNTPAVWEALTERAEGYDVTLDNQSADTALVALQGPDSVQILTPLLDDDPDALEYYSAQETKFNGIDVLLARTGYTGEDGFEIYLRSDDALAVWDALKDDATPCGLACRDSLRLEASMPLYGHELSLDITPVEAGMSRAFAKKGADFVGKQALVGREPEVVIAGLTSDQRRAAREGSEIFIGDTRIGVVTSGQPSPTLGYPVALAHVAPEHSEIGTEVEIDIRGRRYPFTISTTPFYSRKA
ncbi:glycine cleavage system aminomethyltransferase GcvT [Corynebacterium breve]|uniref:Aminomethyltransferase n=1 Tax=Corynebacterium breve TaxID=3049799 RepID=A0ABY8VHJ5_9CORY|nr:glycine cleavage system aminomethyltransferase GcvT [Corynebacterium breve]WIM67010.1 glycine cleavage system aminomethyltransferase GcvT [Corynebacterium breve]